MTDKLYIIVRSDISPGKQIAQACHGIRQFSEEHKEIDKEWFEKSNYLCVLNVENEDDLKKIVFLCLEKSIKFSVFREPDLNDEMTCVVLEPSKLSKKICSNFPLALKECKKDAKLL